MLKAMVVRAGSGWGKALVKQLIGANVEVVAYSGSQRKLEALKEAFSSSSLLRTARGEAGNRSKLLAAAEGVDVIFCGVYLTYDDNPEKVRRMLEAVRSVAAATGAKTVTLEGVYLPADEEEPMNPNLPGATSMRIFSPELYGDAVSNTLIHYALRKIVQGKPVKLLIDPSVRRDYLYVDDAARYVLELASMESAYGGIGICAAQARSRKRSSLTSRAQSSKRHRGSSQSEGGSGDCFSCMSRRSRECWIATRSAGTLLEHMAKVMAAYRFLIKKV